MDEATASSLEQLYLQKRPDLLRFFQARTGSAAAAEDLLQELYLKLRAAPAAGVENGVAYLYRMGLNLLLDKKRADLRSRRRDEAYVQAHSLTSGNATISAEPSAVEAVEARQQLDRLLKAVNHLPPQCQLVFRMHKLDGMSHEEVARALSISRSAVEKHVINALRRLAQEMD